MIHTDTVYFQNSLKYLTWNHFDLHKKWKYNYYKWEKKPSQSILLYFKNRNSKRKLWFFSQHPIQNQILLNYCLVNDFTLRLKCNVKSQQPESYQVSRNFWSLLTIIEDPLKEKKTHKANPAANCFLKVPPPPPNQLKNWHMPGTNRKPEAGWEKKRLDTLFN